jgi:hypothetical protein
MTEKKHTEDLDRSDRIILRQILNGMRGQNAFLQLRV